MVTFKYAGQRRPSERGTSALDKIWREECSRTEVPNHFGARDQFCGTQFFHGLKWVGVGDGDRVVFRMIQAHYIFFSYFI